MTSFDPSSLHLSVGLLIGIGAALIVLVSIINLSNYKSSDQYRERQATEDERDELKELIDVERKKR